MSDIASVIENTRREIEDLEKELQEKRDGLDLLEQAQSKLGRDEPTRVVHAMDIEAPTTSNGNGNSKSGPRPKWTPERRAKTLLAMARSRRKNSKAKKKAAK